MCMYVHRHRYLWTHVHKEIHCSLKFKLNSNQSKEMILPFASLLFREVGSTDLYTNILEVLNVNSVLKHSLKHCIPRCSMRQSSRSKYYFLFNNIIFYFFGFNSVVLVMFLSWVV